MIEDLYFSEKKDLLRISSNRKKILSNNLPKKGILNAKEKHEKKPKIDWLFKYLLLRLFGLKNLHLFFFAP